MAVFFFVFVTQNLPAQNRTLSPAQSDNISSMLVEADRLSGLEKSAQAVTLLQNALQTDAEGLTRKVLSLVAHNYGTNAPDYAVAAANLASVLTDEARYIEADRLMQIALKLGREKLDPHSRRFADVLATSAELLVQQGRSRKAVNVLREEAKIRELQAGETQQLARTYLNLAVAYREMGKYSRGIDAIHKAEQLWKNLLPEGSTLKLYGQSTLLVLYEASHQYGKADLLIPAVLCQCFHIRLFLRFGANRIGFCYRERRA